jgi:DNA-binding response OmpR family regulator
MAAPLPTVLIVEDHQDGANSLAMLLRVSGFDVRVAGDGPAALRAAAEREPDVLILDIGLPGMSGYDVARELRRTLTKKPLVVALSGFGTEKDLARSRAEGFDRHFTKPADPDALLELLRQPRPTAPELCCA